MVNASKLEYLLCSPSYIIGKNYGKQDFKEVLKLLQEYKKHLLLLSGEAIDIGIKPLWNVKREYKLHPNRLFQDSHFRQHLRHGLRNVRSIKFYKGFFQREYGIYLTDDDLFGSYIGNVNWERWQQIEVKKRKKK